MLLAVGVLHVAAIWWLSDYLGIAGLRQSEPDEPDAAISVSLQQARMPESTVPAATEQQKFADAQPSAESAAPAESPPDSGAASSTATASAGVQDSGNGQTPPSASQPKASDDGKVPRTVFRVSAPPSARLSYNIKAQKKGQNIFGSGQLNWQNKGVSYALEGESSLLFITVFSFRSEGTINAENGVSPALYTEKRLRKPETNTHFHRERNLVSFSASTRSYPRQGGEQDRSSVVWQLAGAGRHGGEAFRPGAQFAVFVAGTRDAETWIFDVIGMEEMDSGIGRLKTWHLARKPRAGSYEQRLDVWLAPEREWYPVRLRYTERNGDYLDMTASDIKPAAR